MTPGRLSPRARAPLFALVVVLAAALLAMLFLLDPAPQSQHGAPAARAPHVTGRSITGDSRPAARIGTGAVRVGRRFLRLYVRLETAPPRASAWRELRSLSSLTLAHTLFAQPARPAGGARARGQLAHVQVEPLSSSDALLHATIRRGRRLLRVRCLVQRDRGRWTVTALTAAG